MPHAAMFSLPPLPQGTLFHDRMEPEVLESIKGDLVALEEAYLAQHPGADVRRV
jgi:peptide deformylase